MNQSRIVRVLAKVSLSVAAVALGAILVILTISLLEHHDLRTVFQWVIIPLLIIVVVQTGIGISLLRAAKKDENEL
jgi:ABC-type multidrug transport system permease subunit